MNLVAMSLCKLQSTDTPRCILAFALLLLCVPALSQEPRLVGFAQDTLGNDWRLAQVMDVQHALARIPDLRFIYTNARGNTALQAKHIEDLVMRGVDLLITSPRDREVLGAVIEQVHARGIPVILLTRDAETEQYATFIHHQDLAIGREAARYLAQRLGGRGHILMLSGVPEASTTKLRTQGFMQAIGEYQDLIVTRRTANYLRADAIKATEAMLERGVRFDAIFAQSDSMALGAMMALRRYGIVPSSLPIVGIDYISESRAAIRRGDLSVTFTYPTGGREGAEAALAILQGKPVPREIVLKSIKVTRDNVDEVEPIF